MLQINDPCPVSNIKLQKTGENCYLCNGCNKQVIDFTNATDAEIQAYKGQKICGIFRNEQLDMKPVFHWRKKLLFRFMTFASFLGFTVSPVHADEQVRVTKNQVEMTSTGDKKSVFKPKKKKKRKSKRSRRVTTTGYI